MARNAPVQYTSTQRMEARRDTEFHSLDIAMLRAFTKVVHLTLNGSIVVEVRGFPFQNADYYVMYALERDGDLHTYVVMDEAIGDRKRLLEWLVALGYRYSYDEAVDLLNRKTWIAEYIILT